MKTSAGVLLYRKVKMTTEVLLVHPGGPFWKNRDLAAWSIPKGEFDAGENPLDAARREFREETGQPIEGHFVPLDPITQKGGKKVYAWAIEGQIDIEKIVSNTISIVWPPYSGKLLEIPEVDRGEWFDLSTAKAKINPAQMGFITQLEWLLENNSTMKDNN